MLNRDWRKLPSSWAEENEDPLWVRGPFLTYEGEHEGGAVVVHGHTLRDEVELRANRLGIDMRAASSTAAGLSREARQRIKETLGLIDQHFNALRRPYG